MIFWSFRCLQALALVLFVSVGGVAVADEPVAEQPGVQALEEEAAPTAAQEDARAGPREIEEIVVTARKREESLQQIPIAVTAFTGEALVNRGMDQFSELQNFTPSLRIAQQSTYSNATADGLSIRGQTGGGSQISNDPAVGVYQDGIVNPHVTGLQAAFFDLERVEILKGPQGTLFGRNTTGGAINIISRGADYDDMHGYVEADAGNYSTFNYRSAINIPIIDERLAVRLAYQRMDREGFGHSALTGQHLGSDRDEHYFRGSLRLDFDTLRVRLVYDWLKERENGPLVVTRDGFPNSGTNIDASLVPASGCTPFDAACGLAFQKMRGAQGRSDHFVNYTDLQNFDKTDAWSISLTWEWDLTDTVMLKSVTGRRDMEHTHLTNFSGSDFKAIVTGDPLFPERNLHQSYDLITQELNLSGTAMDTRLDWLVGAYFSDDEGADRDFVNLNQNLKPINGTPFFFMFDAPVVDQRSWAVFTQSTFALTDALALTFGGRYTRENKEQVNAHGTLFAAGPGLIWSCGNPPGSFAPPFTFAPIGSRVAACSIPKRSVTYDGWSWLISLDWQVNDDVLVYVKAAEGFRGGGFDIRSAFANRPPFEPETATDIEVGMKADWFDNRLRTNLAAYFTEYENKQESIIIPGPSTITSNAGEADLYGFEAEITASPVEGLTLWATAAWLDGEYTEFIGASVENPAFNPIAQAPGFDPSTYDADGEEFADPDWTYSIGGRYEVAIGNGVLGIQADYYWVDDLDVSTRRTDFQIPEPLRDEFNDHQGLLNARIDFDVEEWGVNIALWSTNLADSEYQRSGVTQTNMLGVQTGITQEPRMYGVTVTKRFGGG